MPPERWKQVEYLYLAALEREESQRSAFLQSACAGDADLRKEVESLLAFEKPAERFIESPAMQDAAVALAQSENSPLYEAITGQTVAHYRILEKLGEGGMGVVYKAEDVRLGRAVALKFLPPGLARDQQALERFQREARAASALNHPHICTVHDIGAFDGQPFMVMEFLQGHTLKERIQAGRGTEAASPHPAPFTPARLAELGIQIADALNAAHGNGIIHRDVKPANIFIIESGQAKLLDFGLAKLTGGGGESREPVLAALPGARPGDSDQGRTGQIGAGARVTSPHGGEPKAFHDARSFTRPGMMMGTLPYMSPEQARNEELDARTDVFSLGAVLYEMATGRQAFQGESAAEVMSALLRGSPAAPTELNAAFPAELERIIGKALEKDRGLRYQSAAELRADLKRFQRDTGAGDSRAPGGAGLYTHSSRSLRFRAKKGWLIPAAALVCAAALAAYFHFRRPAAHSLGVQDNIILADCLNSTGESVFDDTLKQALRVQLEQSPFLNALSDEKVSQTLGYMGRPRDTRLTESVAREVCLRTGSKAIILSSIAMLGSHYVVSLNAVSCATEDSVGTELAEADSREHVLKALGDAATRLRGRLGESLASIEKFDAPVEKATTSSLEALQAYSLAAKKLATEGDAASIPSFTRAIELDPHFALALARLGNTYANLNEASLAMEPITRAFELRSGVSQMERFLIDSCYYSRVTGDIQRAAQVCEQWKQTYPRDLTPYIWLGNFYPILGRFDQGLEESRQALRLQPMSGSAYANLANLDLILNRVDEARELLAQAQARGFTSPAMQVFQYRIAFLRGDRAEMNRRLASAAGQPGEDMLLEQEADAEAYSGHLARARELTGRTVESALRDGRPEAAATFRAAGALREAAFGNREQARREATAALTMASGRMVQTIAALALAKAGDLTRANELAAGLHKQAPMDTLLETYWLPTIRAFVALGREAEPSSPSPFALRGGAAASELLEPVRPYELELPTLFWVLNVTMCPVEARGEALLALGQGAEAAKEFQKIIDHNGLVGTFPLGALARLGLARAYALEGRHASIGGTRAKARASKDTADPAAQAMAMARAAYQDFFALWSQADAGIPILEQARAEYAKLQK